MDSDSALKVDLKISYIKINLIIIVITLFKSWIFQQNKGVLLPFINGEFVQPSQDELKSTFAVKNPYNGEVLAKSVNCTKEMLSLALDSNRNAFKSWKSLSQIERGRIIYKCAAYFSDSSIKMIQ